MATRPIISLAMVLGTTLNCLHDDLRLPQRRRGIVTRKTDFVRFFRLYGNAATEVVSCTRTRTRCNIGPLLQLGLLYTHPDLTIMPTTNDALLPREVLVRDGRWEFEVDTVAHRHFTLLRTAEHTVEEPSCRCRPSTTNIRGDRGLVAWLEE